MPSLDTLSKYRHINTAVADLIPPNSRVLDVGCWEGNLGEFLLKEKNCIVDGIEYNKDASDKARKSGYRNVFEFDLNDIDSLKFDDTQYDFIVFGDVLEHVLYPEDVLKKTLALLKLNGKVVISLPNIGFIYYRLTHLLGNFDYKDVGVMDKTHVKFYTRSTMKKLFDSASLQIEKEVLYNEVKPEHRFFNVLNKFSPEMFTLQFVYLLTKKK